MNATVMYSVDETPDEGARRLFGRQIEARHTFEALHCYRNKAGIPLFYRVRLKDPDGRKVIRPIHLEGGRFGFGEPPAPDSGKPLYRLPELSSDPDSMVFIVEGEHCVDEMIKRGMLATTSGSATSAEGADWDPLGGRQCVIWPDADEPGKKYAITVAKILKDRGCTVELIDVDVLGLQEKGDDCVDWFRLHPTAGKDEVLGLARVPTVDPTETVPEPLRRPVPPSEPYPIDELGPVLKPACESLRRVIQAPDAVCGASLLAAASLATQGLADVEIDGRRIPLSLWFVTVAESGERKSAVDSEVMRPVRAREKLLADDYKDKQWSYEAKLAEWHARKDSAKAEMKKNKGTGLADALEALGPEPPPPLTPILIAGDFTIEGLSRVLAAGMPAIGAFTDEAALVFGGHGMTKETTARTAGTLCKLWDNGTLDRIRVADGATKLYGRRLALHLMGQPVVVEQALSDDLLAGQGFLARCLLSWPESTAGTRRYVSESLRDDPAMARYCDVLTALHERPLPIAEGERNELDPPALTLSEEAFKRWRHLHDAVEGRMAAGGQYALVKPWASKIPEQCLRLAGVLAVLEDPEIEVIESDLIERAAELVLWHLEEAVRLAGTAQVSVETRNAEMLLNWCHEGRKGLVYSSQVLRYGPSQIRERRVFLEAMRVLEEAGWAEKLEDGVMLDGRHRRHVWRIATPVEGT